MASKQINNEAIVLSHLNRSKEMCEYANSELKDCLTNSIETKNAQIKELSQSIAQHKAAQNESSQSLKHTIDQLSQSILEYDNNQVVFYDNIGSTFKKQTDVSVRLLFFSLKTIYDDFSKYLGYGYSFTQSLIEAIL